MSWCNCDNDTNPKQHIRVFHKYTKLITLYQLCIPTYLQFPSLLPSATKLRMLCFYRRVSVHRGRVPDQVHPPSGTRYPPGTRYTPQDQVQPPGRYTPGPGTPPGSGTPPRQVHPQGPGTPLSRYTPRAGTPPP